MATLILRSSCAPLNGRNDASPPGNHGNADARFGGAATGGGGGGDSQDFATGSRGFAPWTTTASGGSMNSMPTMRMMGDNARDFNHGRQDIHGHHHHFGGSGSTQRDLDYLASLPIQCDVTLVPRIPIHGNDYSTQHAAVREQTFSSAPTSQPRQPLRTIRISKQSFLPCGLNSIVTIDRLPGTTTQGGGGGTGASYLLSLTKCVVNVDDGGSTSEVALPVSPMPSTFQFSFHGDEEDESWDDDTTAYNADGGVHRIGEVYTLFDFSTAVDLYQNSGFRISPEKSTDNFQAKERQPSARYNAPSSTPYFHNTDRKNEVASIMLSLEEESQFIKRSLAALGCASVIFIAALVWTLRQMMTKGGKRGRRRRLVATDTWRYEEVPREIGAVNNRAVSAASEERKDGSQDRDEQASQVSPLGSTSDAAGGELSSGNDEAHGYDAKYEDDMPSEERYLTSLSTPPLLHSPGTQVQVSQDDVAKAHSVTKSSPRHWYLDFLSPPPNTKKHGDRSNDALASPAKQDVSRSLFSPLKSSTKETPALGNEAIAVQRVESAMKMMSSAEKTYREKSSNLPKGLNFDTPIIQSSFSPPPSSVGALQLTNCFESSVSSDENSVVSSRKSTIGIVPLQDAASQEEEIAGPCTPEETKESGCQLDKVSLTEITPNEGSPISHQLDGQGRRLPGAQPSTSAARDLLLEGSSIEQVEAEETLSSDLSSLSASSNDDITEDSLKQTEQPSSLASMEKVLHLFLAPDDGTAKNSPLQLEGRLISNDTSMVEGLSRFEAKSTNIVSDEESAQSNTSSDANDDFSGDGVAHGESKVESRTTSDGTAFLLDGIVAEESKDPAPETASTSTDSTHVEPKPHESMVNELETESVLSSIASDDASEDVTVNSESSCIESDVASVEEDVESENNVGDEEDECVEELNSPPKISMRGKRSLFQAELVERLSQRALKAETSKNDFASSLAKRAAKVETGKASNLNTAIASASKSSPTTPVRKTLTPSQPTQSNKSPESEKFLSDYW